MQNNLIESITRRRSQYALGETLPITKDQTIDLIREAVRQAPSPFNSQSSRAVILFSAESRKLWSFAADALRQIMPAETFEPTEKKIGSFSAGAGTVLFYEDMDVILGLQEQFTLYADHFPNWSEQSNGMAQFAVWAALAEANVGASLQHYNPLIDRAVAESWDIPDSWKLRAQMPFGSNEKPFVDKSFMEDSSRFKIFG